MRKILFIASLPYKNMSFDGERIKSRDVLNILRNMYADSKFDAINYSKNKYVQTLKLLIKAFFHRYDFVFVSKCIVGGSFAIYLINHFKKYRNKVCFYLIGNGYEGFEDKKIYFSDISKCKSVIVESPIVLESMVQKGVERTRMVIFPCVKPNYELAVAKKNYPLDGPLKIIFFSRINKLKGLDLLMDAIIDINEHSTYPKFILDISGGVSNEPEVISFNKEVNALCNQYAFFNNLHFSLKIEGIESYKKLQSYDLHVFPSRFYQECAPGAILDMFIAGIPTLSSDFPSSKFLMNSDDSFFFEMNNKEDLKKQLLYIYENQRLLNDKRVKTHEKAKLYTEEAFMALLKTIL